MTGSFGKKDVAPQAVAFLAVWNSAPAAPSPLESAWRRWQRFVAGWFPFLLGGAVAFLGLTLVASPTAFVYERRLVARERIREEMARMRRDVHDRVYNRLSALSKRIAATGDELNADNAAGLAAIAEDIRSTVGDLQEILGDEVRHTNSALTSVPLAEQIASVCAAQAARLGIAIACEADDGLPEVDALLGWDLQCITEEAITNAVRHGAATHVCVRLALANGVLELSGRRQRRRLRRFAPPPKPLRIDRIARHRRSACPPRRRTTALGRRTRRDGSGRDHSTTGSPPAPRSARVESGYTHPARSERL